MKITTVGRGNIGGGLAGFWRVRRAAGDVVFYRFWKPGER
jgi:predicted dinucleotide-binding enzyme